MDKIITIFVLIIIYLTWVIFTVKHFHLFLSQAWSGGKYKHVIGRPIFKGGGEEECISMAFLYSPPNINNSFKTSEGIKTISLGQQALVAILLTLVYHFWVYFTWSSKPSHFLNKLWSMVFSTNYYPKGVIVLMSGWIRAGASSIMIPIEYCQMSKALLCPWFYSQYQLNK